MSGVAIATAAVAAAGIYSSHQQAKATRQAARMQKQESDRQLKQQQQEFNRANQKEADISGLLNGGQGDNPGATMITGPGGVNQGLLNLGQGSKLLGG